MANIDIAPTIMDMAGLAVDSMEMDGRSILPLIRQLKWGPTQLIPASHYRHSTANITWRHSLLIERG